MSEEELNRILEALIARDSALFAARQRLNELRLSQQISAREYSQARESVEDLQDEITVRIDMVIADIPIIQPPTLEQVEALKASLKTLEAQIAASAAVDKILLIAAEVAEKAAA